MGTLAKEYLKQMQDFPTRDEVAKERDAAIEKVKANNVPASVKIPVKVGNVAESEADEIHDMAVESIARKGGFRKEALSSSLKKEKISALELALAISGKKIDIDDVLVLLTGNKKSSIAAAKKIKSALPKGKSENVAEAVPRSKYYQKVLNDIADYLSNALEHDDESEAVDFLSRGHLASEKQAEAIITGWLAIDPKKRLNMQEEEQFDWIDSVMRKSK